MTDIQGFARLGENPKLKFLPGSTTGEARPVAEVRLCLSNYRKRGEDEIEDRGFWVDASIWGEQGEISARNIREGDKVYVIGDLSSDHWTDRESGEKRSRPKLRVDLIFPDLRSLATFRFKPRSAREQDSLDAGADATKEPASLTPTTPDPGVPFEDMSGRFESLPPVDHSLLASGHKQESADATTPDKVKRPAKKSTAA